MTIILKKIFYLILLLLLILLTIVKNYNIYIDKQELYHKKVFSELQISYSFLLREYSRTAQQIFDSIINKPEVLSIFQEANSDDEKVRSISRERLYAKLIDDYNRIKLRGVRQLQFHLPNSDSFLRFHRPELYGDNLNGIRYSVERANSELIEVRGFEEGRVFNGIRNVFPLIYNGKHIGSVEISMSFQSISNEIEEMLQNKIAFIIKKDTVNNKVFTSEQNNYKDCNLSNDYLFEAQNQVDNLIIELNKTIKTEVVNLLQKSDPFSVNSKYNNKNYNIQFLPIKNIEGQHIAYLVFYALDLFRAGYFYEFLGFTIIIFFVLLITFLLIYQVLNKNEKLKIYLNKVIVKDEKLRLVLKGNRDGFWNWNIKTGETSFNERWAEILGYTLEELSPISIKTWKTKTHPDDLKNSEVLLEKHFTGESDYYELENRMKHKSGKWIWVLDRGKIVEWDNEGKPLIMTGTHTDITQRKQVEEALSESERRLNEAQRIASIGNWMLNLRSNKLKWSDEIFKIFEIDKESFDETYDTFLSLLPTEDREIVDNIYRNSLKTKNNYEISHKIQVPNGMVKYVHERCETEYDESGNPIRSFGTIQDITERIHAEKEKENLQAQLQQSQKMDAIGQLAGGVAHDFNNFLCGIMSASQLLSLPNSGLNEKNLKYVEMITQASVRASDLISKLLTFSRKGNIVASTLDIHEILDDIVKILKGTIDKKIILSVMQDALNTKFNGDLSSIESAFLNLGINASHAMPGGGELKLKTRNIFLDKKYCESSSFDITPGDYLQIEVKDTGFGIPEENLDKIFDPFYSTKELGKGTGLGLSVVYGTIKEHHGCIDVHSKKGLGTTFNIFLPCSEHLIEQIDEMKPILTGTGTILLVDDEELNRIVNKEVLESLGYKVLLAEDGLESIQIFKKRHSDIDVVVMDMIMPKMSGSEAFIKMKEIDEYCKVIISSGYTKNDNIEELLEILSNVVDIKSKSTH